MTNELQEIEPVQYEIEQVHDDASFNAIAKAGLRFLPRVQLFGAASTPVKESKIAMGVYGFVPSANKIIELGKELDILPFVWRPKAIDMSNKQKVVAVYNPKDSAFQEIQERSGEQNSGCQFGPEFLIWVPKLERFATLMFGSVSARMEAPNLKGRLGKPTTLTVDIARNKKGQSWHVIVVNQCSTPFQFPPKAEVEEQVKIFNAERGKTETPADLEEAEVVDRAV